MPVSTTDLFTSALGTSQTSAKEARSSQTKDRVTHDEFLQLLVMQLTHQDPLKPMEDIDFMGQMAQMQALDEQISMTKTLSNMRIDTQIQSTSSLIGKIVAGTDAKKDTIAGVVERVVVENDTVYAQLTSGLRIAAESILQVVNQPDSLRGDLMGAQAMIKMQVTALDDKGATVQGIVEKATIDNSGQIWLQLNNGKKVRYQDIYEVSEVPIPPAEEPADTDSGDHDSGEVADAGQTEGDGTETAA